MLQSPDAVEPWTPGPEHLDPWRGTGFKLEPKEETEEEERGSGSGGEPKEEGEGEPKEEPCKEEPAEAPRALLGERRVLSGPIGPPLSTIGLDVLQPAEGAEPGEFGMIFATHKSLFTDGNFLRDN